MERKNALTQCAHCDCRTCYPSTGINEPMPPIDNAPPSCPMRQHEEVVREGATHYHRSNIQEFARLASIQEAQCYQTNGGEVRTLIPRIEEIMQFADKCGYTALGLAFCIGLKTEAGKISKIFKSNGFDVASVCCKVGRTPKESIGIAGDEKIKGPEAMEAMCNPIVQAELLNSQDVDLAVMLGLCVGHDTLFLKYCTIPSTVLAVKDRVLGHNPLAAVYLTESPYYGRLHKKKKQEKPENKWKKVDIKTED
ncbi:MAG: DUF1847 domain-containing protein [Desulfobacterales bacterium]